MNELSRKIKFLEMHRSNGSNQFGYNPSTNGYSPPANGSHNGNPQQFYYRQRDRRHLSPPPNSFMNRLKRDGVSFLEAENLRLIHDLQVANDEVEKLKLEKELIENQNREFFAQLHKNSGPWTDIDMRRKENGGMNLNEKRDLAGQERQRLQQRIHMLQVENKSLQSQNERSRVRLL